MPAGAINYQNIANLSASTTKKWLNRKGEKYGLINDARPKTLAVGRMFKRASTDWTGGITLAVKIKLERARVMTWMGPTDKLTMKPVPAPQEVNVPRRFIGFSVYKSYAEMDHNKGEKEVVYDVVSSMWDDVCTDTIQEFEDTILSVDGNYAHDGTGSDYLLPLGVLYWITIDGLHITGDTSKTVGGINPNTYTNWKNPYINPVTSYDFGTDGKVTSVFELRECYQRALRMLRWIAVRPAWGAAADKMYDGDTFDPDGPEDPSKDYIILCDPKTQIKYGSIIFDRNDNVAKDQGSQTPLFKGIPVEDAEQLGIDATYGYGFDSTGTALWTDRTGSYASGNWKGYGVSLFLNAKLIHVLTHPNHAPFMKDPYEPEGMFGLAWEGDWWLQTVARSRKRGGCYVGPYAFN